jgi:hypothetical protein
MGEGDRIDLTALGFIAFIGSDAFKGIDRVEMRSYFENGFTVLEFDFNADGTADRKLVMEGQKTLVELAPGILTVTSDKRIEGDDADNRLLGTDGAETIIGKGGNDALFGRGGFDKLIGGLGNDRLDGGTGADTMEGGAGDDIYYVDDAGDQVVEFAGEGRDRVISAISHALAANVEDLTLTGSAFRVPATTSTTASRAMQAPTVSSASAGTIACRAARATTRCSAATATTVSTAAPAATSWKAARATTAMSSMAATRSSNMPARASTASLPAYPTPCSRMSSI